MRLIRIPVLLFLLIAGPVGAAVWHEEGLKFSSPAQLVGELNVRRGTELLLVFSPLDEARAEVHAQSVEAWNHTRIRGREDTSPVVPIVSRDVASAQFNSDAPSLLETRSAWATLVIHADAITFNSIADANLANAHAGEQYVDRDAGVPKGIIRHDIVPSDTILLRTSTAVQPFTVNVDGLRSLEWHNLSPICDSCGGAGGPVAVTPSMDLVHFIELQANGVLAAQGTASAAVLGGNVLDVDVIQGLLRLPLASENARCHSCEWNESTLLLRGDISLQDLRPHGQFQLAARASGQITEIRSDESVLNPRLMVAASVGVVAVAAVAKVVAILASRLFQAPLENDRRRLLHDAILAQPGITYRQLMRSLGLANGVVNHHLRVLTKANLIVRRADGKRTRLFENHGKYDANWHEIAILERPFAREVVSLLQANPGISQGELTEWALAKGWSRAGIQVRITELESAGFVRSGKDGRKKRYWPSNSNGLGLPPLRPSIS